MRRFAKQPTSNRLVLIVAILFVASATLSACVLFRSSYIDRELSGTVTLTPEWQEFTPKEPLKIERDTQEVALFPDPPIKMINRDRGGLVSEDGRTEDIEAELIDSNGITHRSRPGFSQSMTGDLYVTRHSITFKDLPKDITYRTVHIRSATPYPVKRILFRCYNWGDVHK